LGLRLRLLAWWTPKYIIYRELVRVDTLTTDALEDLLSKNSSNNKEEKPKKETISKESLEKRRALMAHNHVNLVASLVDALGKEEATQLGRETMFKVGETLGRETGQKLGIGRSIKDLIRAAKILYRILGIEFEVEIKGPTTAVLIINRCALSTNYSELTCQILSATDEGVIRGLNKNIKMRFTERMTSGLAKCRATIELGNNGGTSY
jgi:predicted ArsR family transcriptional regulator